MSPTLAATATVLVVDDTPANLALLLTTLAQAGRRVLIAESGADALAILARDPVDLILLDVVMPGDDGFVTCAKIKALPSAATVPVLFMTSLDAPAEKIRAFAAGAVDYIVKPVYPPEVVARVDAHLQIRALQRALEARNAELASEVEFRLDAEAQLAHSLDRAVLLATSAAQIVFSSRLARTLLAKYFPGQTTTHLPAAFSSADTHATAGSDTLLIRRLGSPGGEFTAWLLEEQNTPPGPTALTALGLTPRQAEVLYWLAQGKANSEIGVILDASTRTIAKHLERIFQRLAVENRASAMVLATEILRPSVR